MDTVILKPDKPNERNYEKIKKKRFRIKGFIL